MQRTIQLGAVVVMSLLVFARSAASQRLSTLEVGMVGAGEGLPQIGYRYAAFHRSGPGIDIAVATLPHAIAYGVALVGADADAAFLVSPTPVVGLVARVGLSTVAGVGGGGGGAVLGYNFGGGVLVRPSGRTALRLDYTHRRFAVGGEQVSVPSLTLGVGWYH